MTSLLAHLASIVVFAIARIVTVFPAVFTFNFLFSFVLTRNRKFGICNLHNKTLLAGTYRNNVFKPIAVQYTCHFTFHVVFHSSIWHFNSTAVILSLYLVRIGGPQKLWPSGPDLFDSEHRRNRDLNHKPTQFGLWSEIPRKESFVSIPFFQICEPKDMHYLKDWFVMRTRKFLTYGIFKINTQA